MAVRTRWAGLLALTLAACQHPALAALERGDYATACRLAEPLDDWDETKIELDRRLFGEAGLAVAVTPVAPDEVRGWVQDPAQDPGKGKPWLVRVRYQVTAGTVPYALRFEQPYLVGASQLAMVYPVQQKGLDKALGVEQPPKPEKVPEAYVAKEFDEEPAKDFYEEQANLNPAETLAFFMTGGLIAPLLRPETTLVERRETAKERKKREARNRAGRLALETSERAKVEARQAEIDAVTARNAAAQAEWQARQDAKARFSGAALGRAKPTCARDADMNFVVEPGGACEFVSVVAWQSNFLNLEPAGFVGRAVARFEDAEGSCRHRTRLLVPLEGLGEQAWDTQLAGRFSSGPVSLSVGPNGMLRP